ncbi:MAG: class I SAM-dependent methyltransferase, partial [Pseudomonadales bacterium]|nr:class I SAM-dependent methyltransferase [Pseudomonadales bacterium]
NSPRHLERDREVADREGLDIETVEGDMRDLSVFSDATFDLIVHPVSNTFVPDVKPVWREAWRVLKPGGALLAGFDNPLMHVFDVEAWDRGELIVANSLPYSDAESLTPEQLRRYEEEGRPLEFGHTLDDQIGAQIDCGFLIAGFYEDRDPEDVLARYTAFFIATRALKPVTP